ncbi:hypothetical protein C8R45DRAFT_932226 [Mycena sanguinolenta]|nr:hypothetical protein C8R45DRAFT_932226 [Mycena sanguinolenta]
MHMKYAALASGTSPMLRSPLPKLSLVFAALGQPILHFTRPLLLDGAEEACTNREVYDACDVPLDVVANHLLSGGSAVATNFAVAKDGGISRSGSAEASEDEDEDEGEDGAPRYRGPVWEEH